MSARSRDRPERETILVSKSDGWFVAEDEATGIASQGETKAEALANLAEALELSERSVEDDVDLGPSDAPWF